MFSFIFCFSFFFFFFNDTATTEIYTLSLHDALPISHRPTRSPGTRWSRTSLPRTTTRRICARPRKIIRIMMKAGGYSSIGSTRRELDAPRRICFEPRPPATRGAPPEQRNARLQSPEDFQVRHHAPSERRERVASLEHRDDPAAGVLVRDLLDALRDPGVIGLGEAQASHIVLDVRVESRRDENHLRAQLVERRHPDFFHRGPERPAVRTRRQRHVRHVG